jgi:hypothetical protein
MVIIHISIQDDRYNLDSQANREQKEGSIVGTSQAAKAASHDRILSVAAERIRRDGVDSLVVAELMKEAVVGITDCSPDSITEIPQLLSGTASLCRV